MLNNKNTLSEEEISEIKAYPKIELHCHLDGSIPRDLIRTLAKEQNIDLPEKEEEFAKLVTVTNDCKQVMDFYTLFNFPIQLLQTESAIKRSVFALMEEAAKENIKYIEIRFAPQLHIVKGLTIEQVIQASINGLFEANEKFRIQGGIIVCALGDLSSDSQIKVFKAANIFNGKGVIGVDMARVSTEHMNHVETFKVAKELGFNITIHAADFPPAQPVADSIKHLHAQRIGHGVYSALDPQIMQILRDYNIPLEICLTSNIQNGRLTKEGFQKYEDHYVRKLYNEGVKVTINCDNRTISNTTLTNEFGLLKQYFEFKKKEFKQIYLNAVEVAFAKEDVKKWLLEFSQQYD